MRNPATTEFRISFILSEDVMKKNIYVLSVLSAAFLWGIIGIFTRALSADGFVSMETVFVRALGASLLLFMYIVIKDRSLLKISVKDIGYFAGTGILSMVFFNFCLFSAMNYVSLSVATILMYTAPAFVALMSRIIWKEKLGEKGIFAIIFTFIGCVLVCLKPDSAALNSVGILFGIGAGFGYALYSIFARFALSKYSSVTVSFYTFICAMLASALLVDFNSIVQKTSATNLYNIICLGLLSTVLPYILYTFGMKGLSNSSASILATLEPVVASLVGVIAFSESITLVNIVGIAVVVGAVTLSNLSFSVVRK